MNNYFLLNEAINAKDYPSFKEGMLSVAAIEKEEEDTFRRHDSVWKLKIIEVFFNKSNDWTQEDVVLSKFIEQMNPSDDYISGSDSFDRLYPGRLNAFLGIDFSKTAIETERQVTDSRSFRASKRYYYAKLPCNGDKDKIRYCLKQLYGKDYTFSHEAIDDITYWNQKNPSLYAKIHELLIDIGKHPFQGGMGKTEVLKSQEGIASKRINGEHRITYRLEKNVIRIFTCKGHYN
ncbi:MAG: Txe/YoeB family addiction module toxin [Tannerellaceae bacterium]|jgi:toxin YoeB|nr:Txe/YoeB family addiction module toxin [Tannerellaceae bacterium]